MLPSHSGSEAWSPSPLSLGWRVRRGPWLTRVERERERKKERMGSRITSLMAFLLFFGLSVHQCFPLKVLSPCGSRDILCGRVSEIVSNGSELCRTAGFFIHQSGSSHHIIEESCYGGKATFDSVSDSWRQSKSESAEEAEEFGVLNDFHQWTAQMTFIEKVSWAVGGLVLTSGLLLFSRRKRCNRRQKQAALYRATQRMRREWVSR